MTEALAPPKPTLTQILELETRMRAQPQVLIEPVHYFAKGLYARQITIPAGVQLTGRIHRHEHLNIISCGDISIWTEDGAVRIRGPATLVSRPGTKRVGFAHTETVWTTIHAVSEELSRACDIARIEEELVLPDRLLESEIKQLLEAVS
jgi:hypothetical protein